MAADKKLVSYYRGRPLDTYSQSELIAIIEEQFAKEQKISERHIKDMNVLLGEK